MKSFARAYSLLLDIHEAQRCLVERLPLLTGGNEVIVTQAQKPVMRLVPMSNGTTTQPIAGLPEDDVGFPYRAGDFTFTLPIS